MFSCLSTFYFRTSITFFFTILLRPPRSPLFPTRRSSDLITTPPGQHVFFPGPPDCSAPSTFPHFPNAGDRKSTRLNSSHRTISYAVFCLKKKKEPAILCQQKYLRAPRRRTDREHGESELV